jgi:signal transduction histidine kinase
MNVIRLLFSASEKIQEASKRKRAEILSVLLFIRGFGIAAIIARLLYEGHSSTAWIVVNAVIINFICYVISRTRYFQIAAVIVIIEGLILIPVTVLQHPDRNLAVSVGPLWLGLGTLLSSLVLPFRYTIAIIIGTIISFGAIGFLIEPSLQKGVIDTFMYTMTCSFLALIGTYLRDRSDQLLEEERIKMIHISKLSALGEVAAGVAHEINTPLGAIILNAQMIEKKMSQIDSLSTPDILKRTQSIISIGHRISKIIGGLKGFSRDASKDDETLFTIHELIEGALELCSEKFKNHGVIIHVNPEYQEIKIKGKMVQLSQVLLNLLNNSYDAVQSLPEKWIKIGIEKKQNKIYIIIADSGKGIPKEILEKIFQPFYTTKDFGKGTGLGLSISRSLLQEHGGELSYNEKSPNTSFIIQLPYYDLSLIKTHLNERG